MNHKLAFLVVLAACGGKPAAAPAQVGPSCRTIALAAERWIAIAPESERERMLRFAVEVIDLCQAPGLSAATRTCVAGADGAAAARRCPALPLTPDRAALPPDERAVKAPADAVDVLEGELADDDFTIAP